MKAIGLFIVCCLASMMAQAQNNPIFYGGSGDGFSRATYTQTSVATLFRGGQGDGFSKANYVQTTNGTFAQGGIGDGFHVASYAQNTVMQMFTGGIGDGFSKSNYIQPTDATLFAGGIGDGFSKVGYTQPTDFTFSKGGIGDGWAAAFYNIGPLPVQLVSFVGKKVQGGHLLNWTSASEENLLRYELERSGDNRIFNKINAQAATGNGSSTEQHYQFLDATPLNGNNFYRLLITELSGEKYYSNTVLLKRTANQQHAIVLYPNPAATQLNIRLEGFDGVNTVGMEVLDATGKLVSRRAVSNLKDLIQLDVQQLAAGNYLLRFHYENKVETIRFTKE